MSLEIYAPKADALARELATATGEDIDTAVVRAIEERLARTPRQRTADERAAIEGLFDRLAQLPVLVLCRSPSYPAGRARTSRVDFPPGEI